MLVGRCKKMRIRIASLMVAVLLSMPFNIAEGQTTSLAGDWTGESICVGNNPSCHDEQVVYHISINPADSTKVKIAADKVVNGKLEWMGDIELKYDAARQTPDRRIAESALSRCLGIRG